MDLRHFMAVEDQHSVTLHVVSPWLRALPNCRDTISGLFSLLFFPTTQAVSPFSMLLFVQYGHIFFVFRTVSRLT
jgi:hypothetical protein